MLYIVSYVFFCVFYLAATAMSVLESFIQGVGGATARQRVALIIEAESQTSWSRDLMAFVHTLECLMYLFIVNVSKT